MSENVVPITGKQTASVIDELQALVAEDMKHVNATILERMQSHVALIPQLAGHLIASGGKRLRPMLTLASARLIGYEGSRQNKLAACVEFIHTATLLHDDVVDESKMRRGQETANEIWGNQASVLVGDFLFSRSFELMVEDGSLKVLKILSAASSIIAEGEVLQLSVAGDVSTSEETYLKVIESKTAALFAAACEIAGVVAEQGEDVEAALRDYGRYLGIAFQLADDALDYSAKQATLGKKIGDDFREGKLTLPVMLAFRRGDDTEKAFWRRTMEDHDQTEEDLTQALAYLTKHDTLADTLNRARHYGSMAKDALAIFPDSKAKTIMCGIVDFCIDRAY
ncbi:farnesyltranstransferase [Kordiimonas sediminis]|uniref:Octaprenyl diphosphate synthase n=1 Tax=Kordiimonas sediminis TaxID=1735581 RepID=A0A919ASQ5_9PROT|nr:polyprenyl synthetase family protein [Kordiimonas sediminis]GHF23261.1 farnesyltranstransferase [Kordiimonas sediminis]